MIAVDGDPGGPAGKRIAGDIVLDVSWLPASRLASAEAVLADYHLASALSRHVVVADPTGRLAGLADTVAREFARPRWIAARVDDACRRSRDYARRARKDDAVEDAIDVLFAAGVTCHVLLAAALRNPTVRRRYVAVRELLVERDRLDAHERLLALLGARDLSRERVAHHLATLAPVYDRAVRTAREAPFPFASDVGRVSRSIAIDGSRALLDAGLHREAIFWIAVTAARCRLLLDRAGDTTGSEAWDDLRADLGLGSRADVRRRADQVERALGDVRRLALSLTDPRADAPRARWT